MEELDKEKIAKEYPLAFEIRYGMNLDDPELHTKYEIILHEGDNLGDALREYFNVPSQARPTHDGKLIWSKSGFRHELQVKPITLEYLELYKFIKAYNTENGAGGEYHDGISVACCDILERLEELYGKIGIEE